MKDMITERNKVIRDNLQRALSVAQARCRYEVVIKTYNKPSLIREYTPVFVPKSRLEGFDINAVNYEIKYVFDIDFNCKSGTLLYSYWY